MYICMPVFLCVFLYVCIVDVYIHHGLKVNVRGKLGSLFFSSTMSVPGIELRRSGLVAKYLYSLRYLAGPISKHENLT